MFRKLKVEEMSYRLEKGDNGEPVVVIGMYEKGGWKQHIAIRMSNFPEHCESLDGINRFTINCPED